MTPKVKRVFKPLFIFIKGTFILLALPIVFIIYYSSDDDNLINTLKKVVLEYRQMILK